MTNETVEIYYDEITGKERKRTVINKKNLSKYDLDKWAMDGCE